MMIRYHDKTDIFPPSGNTTVERLRVTLPCEPWAKGIERALGRPPKPAEKPTTRRHEVAAQVLAELTKAGGEVTFQDLRRVIFETENILRDALSDLRKAGKIESRRMEDTPGKRHAYRIKGA
jgi:DNA-binding transcriptional ArsR family regulator